MRRPSFSKLVRERKFDQLLPLISPKLLEDVRYPLHSLLSQRPPAPVVARLIELTGIEALDFRGRAPLHTAIASGCDLDVIELLLGNIQVKDASGRTALHWAVWKVANDSSAACCFANVRQLESSVTVISKLLIFYPAAKSARDSYKMTPYDLGVQFQIDSYLLHLLEPEITVCLKDQGSATDVTTDATSELIPNLITTLPVLYNDTDDSMSVSTMGTGGVSRIYARKKRFPNSVRKLLVEL